MDRVRIDKPTWQALFDETAIQRLAETIHAEARGEGELGMRAVTAAIGNRIKLSFADKGYNWGDTPEEIVTFGKDGEKQFSSWNSADPNNPINYPPDTNTEEYKTAYALAEQLANGTLSDPTGGAEHFHATSISAPKWTTGMTPVTIGNHQFYSLLSADSEIVINEAAPLSPTERIQMAFGLAAMPTQNSVAIPSLDGLTFVNTDAVFSYAHFYLSDQHKMASAVEEISQPALVLSQGELFLNAFSNLRVDESDLPVTARQSTYIAADAQFIPMMEKAAEAQGLSAWQKARVMTEAHNLNKEARSATFFDRDTDPGAYAQAMTFYEIAGHADTAFAAEQFGSLAKAPETPAIAIPEEPLFLRAYAAAKEHRPELVPYIEADRNFLKAMDDAYRGTYVSILVETRGDYFDRHFASKPDRGNADLVAQTESFYDDIDNGTIPAVAYSAPAPALQAVEVAAVETPAIETPAVETPAVVPEIVKPSALDLATTSEIILPEAVLPIHVAAYADPWRDIAVSDAVTAIENVIQPIAAEETIVAEDEEPPSFQAEAEEKTDRTFNVKGNLSNTIFNAAKEYGIEGITKGEAWLLSKEVARLNDIANADRVAANREISIPRAIFAPMQ